MDGSRTHRSLQSSPPRGFEDRGTHRDPTIPVPKHTRQEMDCKGFLE